MLGLPSSQPPSGNTASRSFLKKRPPHRGGPTERSEGGRRGHIRRRPIGRRGPEGRHPVFQLLRQSNGPHRSKGPHPPSRRRIFRHPSAETGAAISCRVGALSTARGRFVNPDLPTRTTSRSNATASWTWNTLNLALVKLAAGAGRRRRQPDCVQRKQPPRTEPPSGGKP